VLLKNVVVEMQFSREDGLEPVEGYEPWTSAFADGNAVSGPVFAEQGECEVIMMVGLPASGKSTWAEKWVKEHPEKRFVLLGTNLALDQMKVSPQPQPSHKLYSVSPGFAFHFIVLSICRCQDCCVRTATMGVLIGLWIVLEWFSRHCWIELQRSLGITSSTEDI
jgi:hypothetical protein